MADNPDKDNLIAVLDRICREHRAMTRILREDNPQWREAVYRVCASQTNIDSVHSRFRAVIESQQSNLHNEIDIQLLITALNKTTLL
jgi:hypothetical protein